MKIKESMKKKFRDVLTADSELLKSDVVSVSIFLPSTEFYPKGTVVKNIVAGYYAKKSCCKLGLIITGKTTQVICIQVEDESLLSEDVKNALLKSNTLDSVGIFEGFQKKEVSKSYFFKVDVGVSAGNFFFAESRIDSKGLRFIYGAPVKFLGSFHPPKKDRMIFFSNIEQIQNLPMFFKDILLPKDALPDHIFFPVSKVMLENINRCSNRSVLKPGRNVCFCNDLHSRESKYSRTMDIRREFKGSVFLFCQNDKCKYPLREIANEINLALRQNDLPVY